METIKDKAIVNGAKGVAEFAWDHLKDIMGGRTVSFAIINPAEKKGTIDEFAEECRTWCGISLAEIPKVFGSERTVLCVCYYGSCGYPFYAVLDLPYELNNEVDILAKAINEVADFEEGSEFKDNELIYVELSEERSVETF